MEEPLTSVSLVCRAQPLMAALPHVAHKIDAFLWVDTTRWTLIEAADRGFVRLMDRLVKRKPPTIRVFRNPTVRASMWSAIEVDRSDLHVLDWWLKTFILKHDAAVLPRIFQIAPTDRASFPVLDWIYHARRATACRTNCVL